MSKINNAGGGIATSIGLVATSLSLSERMPVYIEVHQHTEVELIVCEHGSTTMFFGGKKLKIPPDHLTVFWGAMPHYAMEADPKSLAHILRIPMPLVMQWNLPAWLIQQLVNFQALVDAPNHSPCSDIALVKHWVSLMSNPSTSTERIVMLEAEARLRRITLDRCSSSVLAPHISCAGRLERMVEVIAKRCLGRLRISEVAREAGLTRAYAMRLFRKSMGLTMLQYITRQRVSHAQRLLATTNRGVLDVMGTCGFTSPTRFYVVFRAIAGCTPGAYRRQIQPVRPQPV